MENNNTQVVELSMQQMAKFIVDGVIKNKLVEVKGPEEVELNINLNYKANKDPQGNFMLTGCTVTVDQIDKVKEEQPQLVDVNSIIK